MCGRSHGRSRTRACSYIHNSVMTAGSWGSDEHSRWGVCFCNEASRRSSVVQAARLFPASPREFRVPFLCAASSPDFSFYHPSIGKTRTREQHGTVACHFLPSFRLHCSAISPFETPFRDLESCYDIKRTDEIDISCVAGR